MANIKTNSSAPTPPVRSPLPAVIPEPEVNSTNVTAPDEAGAFAPVAGVATDPTRLARIQQLEQVIQKSIQTLSPHDPTDGEHVTNAFTGNYDWHSCVHAHWALLAMAHETGNAALEKWVLDRLTPDVLAKEARFLSSPAAANFEMPYGQEWLLLLLGEMAKRPDQRTPQLMALKNDTENRILNWLEKSPFPKESGPFGGEGPIGSHQSWLFAYWMLQMSGPSEKTKAALAQLKKDRIDPNRHAIANWKPTNFDFLYLPGVLSLIDSTGPNPTEHPVYPPGQEGTLPEHVGTSDAHTAGAAMMRVWPYAQEAAGGDPAGKAITEKRLGEMFANPGVWAANFHDTAHWVPQFAWMAMWLENGGKPYDSLPSGIA